MDDYIDEFKKTFLTESFFGGFFTVVVHTSGLLKPPSLDNSVDVKITGDIEFILEGGVEGDYTSSTVVGINKLLSEYQLNNFKNLIIDSIDEELFEYVKKAKTRFITEHPNTKGMYFKNPETGIIQHRCLEVKFND